MIRFFIYILFTCCSFSIFGQQAKGRFEQTGKFTPDFIPIQTVPRKYTPAVVKHKTTIIDYKTKVDTGVKLDSIIEKVPLITINKNSLPTRKKCHFTFTGKKPENLMVQEAAQFIFKDIANKNIKYTDKKHGFFTNCISDMAQDEYGAIWIGSETDGLCKFTGCKQILFTSASGLPSSSVYQVMKDSRNNIWIGTTNGVCFFKNDSIFTCNAPENKNINVHDLYEDSKGNIWISTFEKGSYCFNNGEIEIFDSSTGLTENWINDVSEDNKGNLWFGTNGRGFVKYDFENFHQYYSDNKFKFNTSMFFADNENFWIAQFQAGFLKEKNGVFYRYHYTKQGKENIYDAVRYNNSIWIADYANGLLKFSKGKFSRINKEDGLENIIPNDILLDHNSNIWIATMNAGIFRFDENIFIANNSKTDIPIELVEGIEFDKQGNLWYLPNGSNLVKSTGAGNKIYRDNEYNLGHVWDAVFTSKNKMWAATYSKGICNVEDNFFTYYQDDGVNVIFDLALVGDSIIYAATMDKGLVKFNFKTFSYYNEKQGLKNNQIDNLFYSSKNALWMSVKNSGISILKDEKLAELSKQNGLCSDYVNFIFEDSQKRMWIGTEDGLNLIAGDKIYKLDKNGGLPSLNIKSVLQVDEKVFWIASDRCLTKLKFTDNLEFTLENFDKTYGANISDFNSVTCKLINGDKYWGTNTGLIYYNSNYERQHKNTPFFTKRCVRFNDTIQISDNNFVFDVLPDSPLKINFGAIDWGYEDKLAYRYCISKEKNSYNWIETKGKQELHYSEMQPGLYYFYVQAKGIQGNSEIVKFTIRFLPKWYQQTIFKIIAIIIIILIVGIFLYYLKSAGY